MHARRLPYLRRDQLDESGRRIWDASVTRAGDWVVTPEGGLAGPFNAWLHAPVVGARMGALGSAVLFGTSLDRRLAELAILTVGAIWRAEFEWWAHAQIARDLGIEESVIAAIGRGDSPELTGAEGVVHGFAHELASTGSASEGVVEAARSLLGDRGTVELVALCGFYTTVAFMLNVFDVPLPEGEATRWENTSQA